MAAYCIAHLHFRALNCTELQNSKISPPCHTFVCVAVRVSHVPALLAGKEWCNTWMQYKLIAFDRLVTFSYHLTTVWFLAFFGHISCCSLFFPYRTPNDWEWSWGCHAQSRLVMMYDRCYISMKLKWHTPIHFSTCGTVLGGLILLLTQRNPYLHLGHSPYPCP